MTAIATRPPDAPVSSLAVEQQDVPCSSRPMIHLRPGMLVRIAHRPELWRVIKLWERFSMHPAVALLERGARRHVVEVTDLQRATADGLS